MWTRVLLSASVLGACFASVPTDRLYPCAPDGGCAQPGFACGTDGVCRAGAEGGGGAGGGTGGAVAGGTGGAAGGSGCPAPCAAHEICGGGGATPGRCSRPQVCRDGFCWENPLPQGNDLRAATCIGGDLWLAGTGGTMLRAVAGGFVGVESGTREDLSALHAVAPDDIYAVGAGCTLLHFDGGSWTNERKVPSCTETLNAVWSPGAGVAYAVGENGRAVRRVPGDPVPWQLLTGATAGARLLSVGGVSAQDVWVASTSPAVWTLDSTGTSLQAVAAPTPQWPLATLARVMANLGGELHVGGDSEAWARRRDAGWERLSSLASGGSVYALFGAGGADVWSLSAGGPTGAKSRVSHLARDGGLFDVPYGYFAQAGCSPAPGEAVLAGEVGYLSRVDLDAGAETLLTRGDRETTVYSLFGLGEPIELVAGGSRGRLLSPVPPLGWQNQYVAAAGMIPEFRSVWGATQTSLWAAGSGPAAQLLRGLPGAGAPVTVSSVPYSVWGSSASQVFIGAGFGRIYVSVDSGTPFDEVVDAPAQSYDYTGMWGAAQYEPIAVGNAGARRRRLDGGFAWKVVPGAGILSAVHGLPRAGADEGHEVWAVGPSGRVQRYLDGGFSDVASPTNLGLHGVAVEAERVWVVGDRGTVLRFDVDGGATAVGAPVGRNLYSVWAQADGGSVFIGGEAGAVLRWSPGR